MLIKGDESQADSEVVEIDFTTPLNDQLPQKEPCWPVGLIDTGICRGEGLLAAHLRLTAPENEGLFLPLEGHELRDESHQLFLELKPQNAAEGMLAALAVGLFNSSLTAISEGSRQRVPLHVRDINLRHGTKGSIAVAQLLQALNRFQNGAEKAVQSELSMSMSRPAAKVAGNIALRKTRRRKKKIG